MLPFDDLAATLRDADRDLRLEIMLEYADALPPLPEAFVPMRDAGLNKVHECQSPVFLYVAVQEGRVQLVADAPPEAPTVRSFLAMMVEAFDGQPPATIAAAPGDALAHLGIAQLIGMQRTRGLRAIYHRIRDEVARKAADA